METRTPARLPCTLGGLGLVDTPGMTFWRLVRVPDTPDGHLQYVLAPYLVIYPDLVEIHTGAPQWGWPISGRVLSPPHT